MDFKDIPKLVINLEHREDRRENIKEVLKDYDYEIVDAVKTKLGCNLSHQKCLKLAIKRKYKYVCIIEDDFIFIDEDDKLKINEYKIPEDFDMFFIGGQVTSFLRDKEDSFKIRMVRRAECYIINEKYYYTYLKMLEDSWDLLNDEPNNVEYRFDVYWQKLVDKDNWRFSNQGIFGGQREGFSDIKNKVVKRSNKNYVK
jgi:GR25 family glycosyltransferase involved in LPS biosynthesis